MAIQILGQDGVTVSKIEAGLGAQRTVPKNDDVDGSYMLHMASITAAAPAAGANLFSFRWGSATKLALIKRIRLELMVTTAATGAALPEIAMYIARSFTASDSTGTAAVLTGNMGKKRTAYATSEMATNGDARIAAAAGVLTAGTRTLDSQPIMGIMAPIALGPSYTEEFNSQVAPIVLAQNEGLVLQNLTAITAGIYRYHAQLEWDEVTTAKYA